MFANFVAAEEIADSGCDSYEEAPYTRTSSNFPYNTYDILDDFDEWALYRSPDDPNEYYVLNKKRAEKCMDAWLSAYGPCTDIKRPIGFFNWNDQELKPWSFHISLGADFPLIAGLHPDGMTKHLMELKGSCTGNPYRFAAWTGQWSH